MCYTILIQAVCVDTTINACIANANTLAFKSVLAEGLKEGLGSRAMLSALTCTESQEAIGGDKLWSYQTANLAKASQGIIHGIRHSYDVPS